MYVWRQRTRRDRGKALLDGEYGWGCAKGDTNNAMQDDELQFKDEKKHVEYFRETVRAKMHQYLNTPAGINEIKALSKIFRSVNLQIDKKKAIYSIFRKYDADGSDAIERDELGVLLDNLEIPIEEKELDALMAFVDPTGMGEIKFDDFYAWFAKEAETVKKKSKWSLFSSIDSLVNNSFQGLVFEAEARAVLMDCTVNRAVAAATKEFRITKPPRHVCPECEMSFMTQREKFIHVRDTVFHTEWLEKKELDESRFKFVDEMHAGPEGRVMRSQRYVFSKELIPLDSRVENARPTPYRPYLSDPGGRRHEQLVKGAMVQGYDPKAGIRPGFRKYGLTRQFRAPGRLPTQPQFQDVIMKLLHCRDDAMDIIVAPAVSAKAYCRFMWKGYAFGICEVLGEFTGWKPEELRPDPDQGGRFCIIKDLGPGKYRYRYRIDGKECLDPDASVSIDMHGKPCNIFQVINPVIDSSQLASSVNGKGRSNIPRLPSSDSGSHSNSRSSIRLEIEDDASADPSGYEDSPSIKSVAVSDKSGHSAPSRIKGRIAGSDDLVRRGDRENALTQKPNSGSGLLVPTGATKLILQRGIVVHNVGPNEDQIIHAAEKKEINQALKHINLRNVCLYDDGAWTFSLFMQNNDVIENVDLSYNGISDDGMQGIGSCLDELRGLKVLNLCGNSFSAEGCRYITPQLKISTALTLLELSKNYIGDDGAEAIAQILVHHKSLQSLILESCLIGDDGCQEIADTLRQNRSLTMLNLGKNRLTKVGASSISQAVRQNGSLQRLLLYHNYFGPDGIRFIADMLFWNKGLLHLDVSATGMASHGSLAGVHCVFNAIRSNRTLQSISVRHNEIDDDKIMYAAFELSFNKTLLACNFEGNRTELKWSQPNTFISCVLHDRLPSIRTSLDTNARIQSDPVLSRVFGPKPSNYKNDDGFEGAWDAKRVWRRVDVEGMQKEHEKADDQAELNRIQAENAYVEEETRRYLQAMIQYIDFTDAGQQFVLQIAKRISQHVKDLSRVDPEWGDWPDNEEEEVEAQELRQYGVSNFAEGSVLQLLPTIQTSINPNFPGRVSTAFPSTPSTNQEGMSTSASSEASVHLPALLKPFQSILRIGGVSQRPRNKVKFAEVTVNEGSKPTSVTEGQPSPNAKSMFADILTQKDFPADHPAYASQQRMKAIRRQQLADEAESRRKEEEVMKEQRRLERLKQREPKSWSVVQTDDFVNTHMAVVCSIFRELGADRNTLMLDPTQIPSAFLALALPANAREVDACIQTCLVISEQKVGFLKFCRYVLKNSRRLCKQAPIQRMRILADLMLHPPIEEARLSILDLAAYDRRHEIRKQYRSKLIKEAERAAWAVDGESATVNMNIHLCHFCGVRFTNHRLLMRHKAKRGGFLHKRYMYFRDIAEAQREFLRLVKSSILGFSIPTYFQCADTGQMPQDYFPQVIDHVGPIGRPYGALDQDACILVEDMMGDYLRVRFQGSLGWSLIRYQKYHLLRPACQEVPGFSWDGLEVFKKPMYYRVRNDIRARLELKVRHFPKKDALVCGYLAAGMVVEVRAIFNNWLQIKFQGVEAAWVVRLTGGGIQVSSPVKGKLPSNSSTSRPNSAGSSSSPVRTPVHVNRIMSPSPAFRPGTAGGSPDKLQALNAALKETRISGVAEAKEVVGSHHLQLGPSADDDASVNSIGSDGSAGRHSGIFREPSDGNKGDKGIDKDSKKKRKKKKKKEKIRRNVDKLLASGEKIELLECLHPVLQRRLVHTIKESPTLMTDEELEFEDEEEEEFKSLLSRIRDGTDTEEDAIALEYLDERLLTPMYR